jgi:glycine C-acetyltransferase
MALFDKCAEFVGVVDRLKASGQFFYLRVLTPAATPVVTMTDGKRLIQLGSNNYLGLTSHPKVVEAAVKSIEEFGTGSCSSRVLTGTTRLHVELERRLASLKGTEDCVVFSAGFMTMMGTIQALAGDGEVIFSDELNHA